MWRTGDKRVREQIFEMSSLWWREVGRDRQEEVPGSTLLFVVEGWNMAVPMAL